jgi:hypothetical protein
MLTADIKRVGVEAPPLTLIKFLSDLPGSFGRLMMGFCPTVSFQTAS